MLSDDDVMKSWSFRHIVNLSPVVCGFPVKVSCVCHELDVLFISLRYSMFQVNIKDGNVELVYTTPTVNFEDDHVPYFLSIWPPTLIGS